MNQLTSATSPANVPALPDEWAERIFQRMENFYLSKWVDSFGSIPRERVKRAWAEELYGYSPQEIKRGLDACRAKVWPPSLPEFLLLCRPVLEPKAEWLEACEQMPIRLAGRGDDKWSRPQVYWAAAKIGAFDLQSMSWDQIKTRWIQALENARVDPIPEYRAALPAPGKHGISREEAEKCLANLKKMVSEQSKEAV